MAKKNVEEKSAETQMCVACTVQPAANVRRIVQTVRIKPDTKDQSVRYELLQELPMCGLCFQPGVLYLVDGTQVELPSRPISQYGKFGGQP